MKRNYINVLLVRNHMPFGDFVGETVIFNLVLRSYKFCITHVVLRSSSIELVQCWSLVGDVLFVLMFLATFQIKPPLGPFEVAGTLLYAKLSHSDLLIPRPSSGFGIWFAIYRILRRTRFIDIDCPEFKFWIKPQIHHGIKTVNRFTVLIPSRIWSSKGFFHSSRG